jgi:hypothetical protein
MTVGRKADSTPGAYQNSGRQAASRARASTGSARTANFTTHSEPTPFALSLSKGGRPFEAYAHSSYQKIDMHPGQKTSESSIVPPIKMPTLTINLASYSALYLRNCCNLNGTGYTVHVRGIDSIVNRVEVLLFAAAVHEANDPDPSHHPMFVTAILCPD